MWDVTKLQALAAAEARERNTSHEVELAMTDFARMRGITYLPYDRSEARERLHRQLPAVLKELDDLPRGVVPLRDELRAYADGVREQLGLARGQAEKVPADKAIEVDGALVARAELPAPTPAKQVFDKYFAGPPSDQPRDRGRGR